MLAILVIKKNYNYKTAPEDLKYQASTIILKISLHTAVVLTSLLAIME